MTQKKLDTNHALSKSIPVVTEWYNKLQKVIEDKGIVLDNIWNIDKTGFRIRIGKDHLIITKRKKTHYFGLPENRESATVIKAISARGSFIPLFLILSGKTLMKR